MIEEEELSNAEAIVAILVVAVAATAAQRRIPLTSYQVNLWNSSKSSYQSLSK